MTNEEITHLTGTAFAQLAVVEALGEHADLPGLLAKLNDPDTRGSVTDEDANVIAVYASCATLALGKVVDMIAAITDADYQTYYDQWIATQVGGRK